MDRATDAVEAIGTAFSAIFETDGKTVFSGVGPLINLDPFAFAATGASDEVFLGDDSSAFLGDFVDPDALMPLERRVVALSASEQGVALEAAAPASRLLAVMLDGGDLATNSDAFSSVDSRTEDVFVSFISPFEPGDFLVAWEEADIVAKPMPWHPSTASRFRLLFFKGLLGAICVTRDESTGITLEVSASKAAGAGVGQGVGAGDDALTQLESDV
mmetsp:Transcript_1027/g.2430  ORF Transcript_1027/g.2430 Transcript_1027/m.2430 type:complete len:216 (-) Transcript_1027:3034-3681(-)